MIDMPFNPFMNSLYNRETLFKGYQPGNPESYEDTPDQVIYLNYLN